MKKHTSVLSQCFKSNEESKNLLKRYLNIYFLLWFEKESIREDTTIKSYQWNCKCFVYQEVLHKWSYSKHFVSWWMDFEKRIQPVFIVINSWNNISVDRLEIFFIGMPKRLQEFIVWKSEDIKNKILYIL